MMTVDEFVKFRNVKIKEDDHKRIIEIFYKYLSSVSGDNKLLPNLIEKLLNIDLSNTLTVTACFNGINDGSVAPFGDVDLYLKFENDIRVFVYGSIPTTDLFDLKENEFVIFILTDILTGNINRINRYTFIN